MSTLSSYVCTWLLCLYSFRKISCVFASISSSSFLRNCSLIRRISAAIYGFNIRGRDSVPVVKYGLQAFRILTTKCGYDLVEGELMLSQLYGYRDRVPTYYKLCVEPFGTLRTREKLLNERYFSVGWVLFHGSIKKKSRPMMTGTLTLTLMPWLRFWHPARPEMNPWHR